MGYWTSDPIRDTRDIFGPECDCEETGCRWCYEEYDGPDEDAYEAVGDDWWVDA